MDRTPSYGCRDYRQEMRLVGLHQRLRQDDLTDAERQALEEEIRQIEAERFG
jgi:hypothetical protein